MRLLLSATVLGCVLLGSPEAAEACSCGIPLPYTWPQHEARGVPLNTKLYVAYDDSSSFEITLRELATSEEVALVVESSDIWLRTGQRLWVGSPAALEPQTEYQLTWQTEWVWVQTTFTTGATMDMTPPSFEGLESIRLETMTYPIDGCRSSCVEDRSGHISRIHLDYTYPEDAVIVILELLDPTTRQPVDQLTMIRDGASHYLGFETCEVRAPVLDPEGSYCARLTAYDLAGNASGGSVEICESVTRCAPEGSCEPAATCTPESSGCSAGESPGGLALLLPLGAALLRRRRRA